MCIYIYTYISMCMCMYHFVGAERFIAPLHASKYQQPSPGAV